VLAGGPLTAQATLIKSGRRVAFLEVAVSQGDRAIARGSFSYLVG
jgi:acyl-coenzyme A thioesterase PaaI-like protein